MKILEEIIKTATANEMREITVERAKQIAIEYAKECINASLDKASEKAEYGIWQNDDMYLSESNIFINRESITNPENIVLL